MVKVVNGTVVWAVPFTAPGTWRAERELSDSVAEAVEEYMLALLDAYRPQQEEFDEEALRRDFGEIVATRPSTSWIAGSRSSGACT